MIKVLQFLACFFFFGMGFLCIVISVSLIIKGLKELEGK
jgi:hypothetical protein